MAETEKEKPKTKGRNKKDKEIPATIESKVSFLKDERLHRVSGMLILLLTVLLAVAFGSFLTTYKLDAAEVSDISWSLFAEKNKPAANAIGWLGAWISFIFFYKGFGIASFLLLPIFFISGWKLIFPETKFKIWSVALHCIPAIIWLSLITGLFIQMPFWSGAFGVFLSDWLQRFIGFVGTVASAVFFIMVYFVVMFNIDFRRKPTTITLANKQKLNAEGKLIFDEESEVKEWEKAIVGENKEELNKRVYDEPITIEKNLNSTENKYIKTEEIETDNDGFELITKDTSTAKINTDDELSLDIQIPTENNFVTNEEPEEELIIDAEEVLTSEPYDPTLDLPNFKSPPLDMLNEYGSDTIKIDKDELERNKNQIVETLKNYNIEIAKIKATIGPTVTLYEIVPAPGVRISKIKNLEDDIALALSALGIRIIAPIPGKGTIGIEVPNAHKEVVSMKSLLASEKFQNAKMDLPIALGKNIANEIFIADLAKMPHLLMAGATGQGKSVGINSILVSLLYKKHPAELKFVMVDPKKVELSLFKLIEKHFLAKLPGEEDPIITDTKKVIYTLNALCVEMDNRYDLLKEAGVRNIKEYNAKFIARRLNPLKGHQFLPYIVLVVDEFADLMMTAGKEVETPIARIAQLARAVGIHLVIATQRPSVNIITGVIKANFPARIAFKVTSTIDSRTILDAGGANQLIGRGDMLFSNGGEMTRLQCGFVDTPEVEAIAEYIGKQQGYSQAFMLPEYEDEKGENMLSGLSEDERDPMFEEAARIIVTSQVGSTSMLQRKLKLGYNRAGRLMDQLEQAGVVGPNLGSKAREVTFKDISELERFLGNL
jgi:S-DNA-T family DNA segregation ATPase FtsK/SpoIIIE